MNYFQDSKITAFFILTIFAVVWLFPFPAEASFIFSKIFGKTVGSILGIVTSIVLAVAGGGIIDAAINAVAAGVEAGSSIASIALEILVPLQGFIQSTAGAVVGGTLLVGTVAKDAFALSQSENKEQKSGTPYSGGNTTGGQTQTSVASSAIATAGICGVSTPAKATTQEDPAITAGIGKALSCPAGNYLSGEKYCVPVGKVSCDSVGKADAYCPEDYTCTSDLKCESTDKKPNPVTVDFKADNPTAVIGTKVVLSWTSTGATSCELDHNIGGVKTSGYLNVSCTDSGPQSLTLKCAGQGGEVSKTTSIDCQKKPPSFTEITPFGSGTKIKCGTGVEIIY